jgi:tetratricopeptide (TPR) repeat protein
VQRGPVDAAGQALAQSQQLLGQGRPDMVLPLLEDAVARYPLDARLRVNLGLAHLQLGRSEEALTILAEAEKLDPTLLMAPFNRAAACLELGRNEEALEHVDRALVLSAIFAPAHMVRARALLGLERDAEAREAAEQALLYDPNMALAHEVLGEVAHRAGDDATARTQYMRAAQLASADPRPWPGIFRFALAIGDLEMAGKALEGLERVNPRDPGLPALRDELERARNP